MSPQLAIDAAGPRLDPRLGQWFTPPELARDLVRWAQVPDDASVRVLEPSAGAGSLVRAVPRSCAVTAVEIDGRWLPDLAACSHEREYLVEVIHGDFFEVAEELRARHETTRATDASTTEHTEERAWPFDLGIANPPYEDALDAKILRAAAALCTRVCAIVPLNALATEVRYRSGWRWLAVTRLQVCCTRPGFGGQHGGGTRDIAFVEVVERETPRAEGEEDVVRVGWRP